MAVNWQWNNFILTDGGDSVRNFAKEHDLFIYPYDILTGSDIAMFESIKVKDPKQRFIICGIDDMRQKKDKEGKIIYEISTWSRISDWDSYCSDSYEGAVSLWNERMKKTSQRLLRPPFRRFLLIEYPAIVMNLFLWGFIFFVVALNNDVFHFFCDHSIFTFSVFVLLCSNVKNIFVNSYGEEIPREILQNWAYANTYGYNGIFFDEAMHQWPALKEFHENSIPIYLMWKRGKLRKREAAAEIPKLSASTEDTSHQEYCEEIKAKLNAQINDLANERTKISDKAIKKDIEAVLDILREIQHVISYTDNAQKILSARRVVSYWNEEVISLLNSYMLLINNSSDEASATKSNIEAILRDVYPVYQRELSRINETNTIELNASISVMRDEIYQALKSRF